MKNRIIISSILTIALCLSMIAGSTFALFTSESKVDIAVTSGEVKVVATADNLQVGSSFGSALGSAAFTDKKNQAIKVSNLVPGDFFVFHINIKDESSVPVMYKVDVKIEDIDPEYPLAKALTVYFDGKTAEEASSGWAPLTEKDQTVEVKIAFPDAEDNNEYQGGACMITYTVHAVQGNADYDVSVSSLAQLKSALELGRDNITLAADITLDETLVIPEGKEVTLNLGGKTITGTMPKSVGHVLVNNGTLTIKDGTISSTATNGGSAILNKGVLTLNEVTVNGAPSDTATGTASYAVNTEGVGSVLTVNNSNISGRGAIGATKGTRVEINGGTFHTPAVAWGHAVYASNEGTEVVINDGTFSEGYEMKADNWGMYQIYSGDKAKVTVNGGTFMPWDCANGYDLSTASEGTIVINGGTFSDDPTSQNKINYVAEGCKTIKAGESTWIVYTNTSASTLTLPAGATLDLDGVEFLGKVVANGDLTIKGDTKIKTLSATNGGTITIEDGKTLTLNNFSFGSKDNNTAEYDITGGTVTANYGFFQHGKYDLYSNFETGYMYYSYGSDITVYGTFHSKGTGDGLDYVRGKLTIANGGKSIHDKSLWVGQPANWGAMSATLIVEEGGYVQANSLSVHDGSAAYNSAANLGKDNVGVKYNTLTGSVDVLCSNSDELVAAINARNTEIFLLPGDYDLRFTNNTNFNVDGITIKGLGNNVNLAISSSEAWYGRVQGSDVTFENIHFTSSVGATGKATYNNCTFDDWTICASSNKEETTFNNCTINGCLNTSTDFSSGDVFVNNCKIAKAEYSGSMTMNFVDCQIDEIIIWNANTNLTNCKVTKLDNSNVTNATVTVK